MKEWDRIDDQLAQLGYQLNSITQAINAVAGQAVIAGFNVDTKQFVKERDAFQEYFNEAITTIRKAMGSRDAYRNGRADYDREVARSE